MPQGGSLEVRAGRSSDGLWWEVADSGVGMSDDVQRRLFEPLFTTKKLGTGLGLAVAHGIVTTHRGTIEVTSALGEGSTIRITLPAASDEADALEARPAAAGFDVGHGERVLVVEDEPAAREGLTDILDMIGYAVESVESAEAALALESTEPFDVLLTDFVLPGRNGLELAAILSRAHPGLGVILMSGYAEDTALNGGTLPDHVRYLQKPFDARTLSRMLRDVLEGG
jgi:CheY-like chemotaxis protein